MIGMRFGSIPVVRKVGGLADTVRDYISDDGWGVVFEEYNRVSFEIAFYKALYLYLNKKVFNYTRKRCMLFDFSWSRCARDYIELYNKIKNT